VPEDRLAADLNQRLRNRNRLLPQPRAASPTKNRHWRPQGCHVSGALTRRPRTRSGGGGGLWAVAGSAGNCGEDRCLGAVLDRCVEAVLEADVLTRDVDVDEAAQVALLGDPLAQIGVLLEHGVERLADGRALDFKLALAAGGGLELGGDLDGDGHRPD